MPLTECAPPAPNIAARFVRVAESMPERPAVVIDGVLTSYGAFLDLARRVVALGRRASSSAFLAGLGNRRLGQYVASVAAPLGGWTFVPMFSGDPVARHVQTLERTGASVLVIDESAESLLPALFQAITRPLLIIAPHRDAPGIVAPAPHVVAGAAALRRCAPDAAWRMDASNNAYLLFTSGSTGQPKGVPLTHRNLCSFIESAIFRLAPTAQDRFAQLSNLTWDVGILETLVGWSVGACVYRLPDSLPRIARFVHDHALSFWFSTPSVGHALADLHRLEPGALASLRCSVFAGEALPDPLLERWQLAAPHGVIENFYGPTEASVSISCYRWRSSDANGQFVPIGEPFPGQQMALRNAEGKPVRDGEIGELYLAGDQVVSGYWHDSEQTQQRFVRCDDGLSWYRTGDLAQRTGQGYVFRGRVDDQMKIRGYRIERPEAEALLREAAESNAVAVIVLPLRDNGAILGLHAVVADSPRTAAQILHRCREIMPAHMVPVAVHLQPLPRNPSGKVDYRRLTEELGPADFRNDVREVR